MVIDDTVADILEREAPHTIAAWLTRVDAEPEIISIQLSAADRIAHLPAILQDIVTRLRDPLPLGTRALMSDAASDHGLKRREQGYSPSMMVEESRMLQVSLFETLQVYLQGMSYSILLGDVMAIADEVDSQLAQAMASFIYEANSDEQPIES
jgi:hypothetical protein